MEITEVRISPSKGGRVRAFASIVIDDCFIVNDLRVMEGREGQLFVTMPARKVRNGQLRDIAHPLNTSTRRGIEERVIEEFEQAVVNLTVPSRRGQERGAKTNRSPLAWLSAKLFADEYWAVEAPGGGRPEKGKG